MEVMWSFRLLANWLDHSCLLRSSPTVGLTNRVGLLPWTFHSYLYYPISLFPFSLQGVVCITPAAKVNELFPFQLRIPHPFGSPMYRNKKVNAFGLLTPQSPMCLRAYDRTIKCPADLCMVPSSFRFFAAGCMYAVQISLLLVLK